MKIAQACGIAGVLVVMSGGATGTELTFLIDGLSNFALMPGVYGDRVVMLDDGVYHYDEHGEGFTPNVEVSYSDSVGQSPAYWQSGYGDLTEVYFEDADGIGLGEIVLTADYGYEVVLYGFEMAAYSSAFSSDPTIRSVSVGGCSSVPLFEVIDPVISETTSTAFDFSDQPLQAREIRVMFDSSNLSGLSDDICIDNLRFGQVAIEVGEISCPADFAPSICVLDFLDISAFIGFYNNQEARGDINGDGEFDFIDISLFIQSYTAGCDTD